MGESAEIWRTRASKNQQEGTSNVLSALCKADIPTEILDVIRQAIISAGLVVDDPNDIYIETGVIAERRLHPAWKQVLSRRGDSTLHGSIIHYVANIR